MDINDKINVFYHPENQPDRSYESLDIFTKHTPDTNIDTDKTTTYFTKTYIEKLQDTLNDLTILLDVLDVTPESIRPTITQLTKALIVDIIIQINEKTNETTTPSETDNTGESDNTRDTTDIPSIVDVVDTDTDADTLTLDQILPKPSNIDIAPETYQDLVDILSSIYDEDRLGLKQDYLSKMYFYLQSYLQQMFAVSNGATVADFSYFLKEYDPDAVTVTDKNLKHLHDTIARMNILTEEEGRFFARTHNSDKTLSIFRHIEAAYQQRKKYYGETYAAENEYLQTESNSILNASRTIYDANYNKSIYNAYKYLNSATKITDTVLKQTAESAKAKGKLLASGVDIFKKTPEPKPEAIGNTAMVTPKLTAETDIKNRYETPIGAGTSGSNGSGSVAAANLQGSEAAEQVWNFLRKDMNLTPELSAGIMGNWQQEHANFDTSDDSGGLGIMQWTGSRRNNCIRLFPDSYTTLSAQLSFFKWEATSGESGEESYWQQVLSSDISTPQSAADAFCEHYERPGDSRIENRESNAVGFYQIYNK
jgi:hypothetical protein